MIGPGGRLRPTRRHRPGPSLTCCLPLPADSAAHRAAMGRSSRRQATPAPWSARVPGTGRLAATGLARHSPTALPPPGRTAGL